MKYYFFLILFFFCKANSQNLNLLYKFERKIAERNLIAEGNLRLDLKNQKSLFTLSQYKNLILEKEVVTKQGDTSKIVKIDNICYDNKKYFFNYKSLDYSFLLYDVDCNSKTLIKGKFVQPEWSINPKLKKFKKFNVYEATATINQRVWTVLFTKDLKIKNLGPWLFNGLPGIVVFASDSMNEYFFELENIDKKKLLPFEEPNFSKKSSFEQYVSNAISAHKTRMTKYLSKELNIPENEVDFSNSPKYQTLDFIEK